LSAQLAAAPFAAGCGADCSCLLPHWDPRSKRIHVFSTNAWKAIEQLADGSYVQVDVRPTGGE
jgi:hypothetical protein